MVRRCRYWETISPRSVVVSPDTFKLHLIYAGNAIQTLQATDAKRVITVRIRVPAKPPVRSSGAEKKSRLSTASAQSASDPAGYH